MKQVASRRLCREIHSWSRWLILCTHDTRSSDEAMHLTFLAFLTDQLSNSTLTEDFRISKLCMWEVSGMSNTEFESVALEVKPIEHAAELTGLPGHARCKDTRRDDCIISLRITLNARFFFWNDLLVVVLPWNKHLEGVRGGRGKGGHEGLQGLVCVLSLRNLCHIWGIH